jgi:cell division protein ZapB
MTPSSIDQPLALQELEDKLDRLIGHYQAVKNENNLLKTQHQELLADKAELLEKTAAARARVEAMITRLQSLEQPS